MLEKSIPKWSDFKCGQKKEQTPKSLIQISTSALAALALQHISQIQSSKWTSCLHVWTVASLFVNFSV